MGNTILTNDQLVTFPAVANALAGASLSSDRDPGDRALDVGVGSKLGKFTVDATALPGGSGLLEVICFKVQRAFATPVVGTDPIPTDAEIITGGLQGTYRRNMPGWVIKYFVRSQTVEQAGVIHFTIDWGKYKMGTVRGGDFYGITYFNRSTVATTLDWQCRYKEYRA